MPAIRVDESITINAPVGGVRAVLEDFRQWPAWSPWLYTEPDAQLDYRGQAGQIGHGYDWRGNMVGAGGMTLIGNSSTDDSGTRLDMDLQFIKPFKSRARTGFTLKPVAAASGENSDQAADPLPGQAALSPEDAAPVQATRVTWHMDSKLPFFMFFMTSMMNAMIKGDYRRGLKMLKDQIETGSIPSTTQVQGIVESPELVYVSTTHSTAMHEIGASMDQAYRALANEIETRGLTTNGTPFAQYTRMNIKEQNCTYIAGIPVIRPESTDMQVNTLPSVKALKVVHTGSYQHLPNAWSTAISHQRFRKLKPRKDVPPFECYMNDPESTPATELLTEIYIPVR